MPDTEVDAEAARVVGSFYQALLTGLMVQSLLTPEAMPSGRDLATALAGSPRARCWGRRSDGRPGRPSGGDLRRLVLRAVLK